MKVDGPIMPGDGSQVMYLKKRMTMRPGGILMQPNATYIPELVGLMKVSGRRKKVCHTMRLWKRSVQI